MNKNIKEIKNINTRPELLKKLNDSQRELLDLRVENKMRKLKNNKALTMKRKEIAILKTRIHEKELVDNAG